MVKQRQQSTKKGKTTSGNKSKSHKGKQSNAKRGTKHQKSKNSKRASSSSSSSKKQNHHKEPKQKGKTPSKFNLYMKTTVQKIKQDHPDITQKDAFKMAAEQWAVSSDNPKNRL